MAGWQLMHNRVRCLLGMRRGAGGRSENEMSAPTQTLHTRIQQEEASVASLQETLSKRYRGAKSLRESIDQKAAQARMMEHCIIEREQRAAAHASRAVQEMSGLRRLPVEFLNSLDQTEARDCICAVHAEAQRMHNKIQHLDRSNQHEGAAIELDRKREQRDHHAQQMEVYVEQQISEGRLQQTGGRQPELHELQDTLDRALRDKEDMILQLQMHEQELLNAEAELQYSTEQLAWLEDQLSKQPESPWVHGHGEMLALPPVMVTMSTQTASTDSLLTAMEGEVAAAVDAFARQEKLVRQKLLSAQAKLFEDEIEKLKGKLRAAEVKMEALASHALQDRMLNHYKARAAQAEKTLARSRLRLVGRSLVLMAQIQRGKDCELPRKSGYNAMESLLALEHDSKDAPMRQQERGDTARASAVHMGVALDIKSAEFAVRVLRHNPHPVDYERLMCQIVGNSHEWLVEFEVLSGHELVMAQLTPPMEKDAPIRDWKICSAAVRCLYVMIDQSSRLFEAICENSNVIHKLCVCAHRFGAARTLFLDANRAQVVCFRMLACMAFNSRKARDTAHASFSLLRDVTSAPSASTGLRGAARSPPMHAIISCLLDRSSSGECKAEALKLLNVLLAALVQPDERQGMRQQMCAGGLQVGIDQCFEFDDAPLLQAVHEYHTLERADMTAQLHEASISSTELTRDTELTQTMLQQLRQLATKLKETEDDNEMSEESFALQALQVMDSSLALNQQTQQDDDGELQKTKAHFTSTAESVDVECEPATECEALGQVKPLSRRPENTGNAPPVRMRPLRWTKLMSAPEQSIWNQNELKEAHREVNSLLKKKHWMSDLIEGFGSTRNVTSPGAQKNRKSVLDPQRMHQLQKKIQQFAMPISELRPLIESCDVRLDLEAIKTIQELLPPAHEQVSLLAISESPNKIAATDVYLKALAEIPTLAPRLSAMAAMRGFEDKRSQVSRQVVSLVAACRQVERSQALKWLLGALLALGNLFNGGSALGGAKAFKTDMLPTLANAWARQRDATLLHHLHQLLAQTMPDGSSPIDSSLLSLLKSAASVRVSTMQQQVNELQAAVHTVATAADSIEDLSDKDVFRIEADDWTEQHEPVVEKLVARHQAALGAVNRAKAYLGQEASLEPHVFFGHLHDFMAAFVKAALDNPSRTVLNSKWALVLQRHREHNNSFQEIIEMEKQTAQDRFDALLGCAQSRYEVAVEEMERKFDLASELGWQLEDNGEDELATALDRVVDRMQSIIDGLSGLDSAIELARICRGMVQMLVYKDHLETAALAETLAAAFEAAAAVGQQWLMAEQEALAWKEQQDMQSDELASRNPVEGLSAIERHAQTYADMQGDTVILKTLKKMGSRDIAETLMMQRRFLVRRMAQKWMIAAGVRTAAKGIDSANAVNRWVGASFKDAIETTSNNEEK